jgi:protein-S-isoprenylcysteine O-methyltransferase Ste14
MLARAIIAFIALPGVVGFLLPLGWAALTRLPLRLPSALVLVAAGTALLLWCVREFYVAGKGTLAPWQPPRRLVVSGPYRVSRNPMYVAVVLVLLGWAAAYRSAGLALYAAAVAIAFQLRVVLAEEPWLAHTHGAAWRGYAQRVRRWF